MAWSSRAMDEYQRLIREASIMKKGLVMILSILHDDDCICADGQHSMIRCTCTDPEFSMKEAP